MNVPYLNLPRQFADDALWKEIKKLFETCQFIQGPEVERFESAFAELCGSRFALGLNSGTDAIFLALKAFGIGSGDEVITVPNTFVSTVGAIVAADATPVFVDVGPDYNMDANLIEGAITPKTKAIIPVHLTGNMADMREIMEIARKHHLFVLEDAAQAVMASINGQRAGSFGDVGCFSLHPLKNLNVCGDGGVLTTDSEDIRERIKMLRNHGLKNRDEIAFFGYNSRLDTLHAVIGLYGMKRLEEVIQKRITNAALYDQELQGLEEFVVLPRRKPDRIHVYHLYVVQVTDREKLMVFLAENGIETKIHYPLPIHHQKPYRDMGYQCGDLPVCEAQVKRILTLPIHQYLSPEQIIHVAKMIKTFYGVE